MKLSDFYKIWKETKVFDDETYKAVLKNWDCIAKPLDGLGKYEKIIARIGAIQGKVIPDIKKRALLVFIADNGIVEEGVSQCDSIVTHSVAEAMARRESTVCVMAKRAGVDVFPVDIGMKGESVKGIEYRRIREGTRNFLKEAAMTECETETAMENGYISACEIFKRGYDILLLGEMGIGNTSSATAVSCALLGLDPFDVVGCGAGLSGERMRHKCEVIKKALQTHKYDKDDAFEVLSVFGGYDIAGMVGALLAAAQFKKPVVLDGLITLAAAFAAEKLFKDIKNVCIASHFPREKTGRLLLDALGLDAPIYGDMALGEGTGAVLLIPQADVCLELYINGRRFENIGVEAYKRH